MVHHASTSRTDTFTTFLELHFRALATPTFEKTPKKYCACTKLDHPGHRQYRLRARVAKWAVNILWKPKLDTKCSQKEMRLGYGY
jgi:hypothetical protein